MLTLSESEIGADHPAVDSALAAAQAFLENSKAFVNLTIYEQRIHRIMEKALAQLKQLQGERKERKEAELQQAVLLNRLNEKEGKPYDPKADGFVFSSAQVVSESARRQRIETAEIAERYRQYGPRFPRIANKAK
jgi:hypothetical protein